jgi:D-aminopeptidase
MLGLARTGGIASNGSGDYVIAVSNAEILRIAHSSISEFNNMKVLRNEKMSPLFLATIEATEEAILNSLFQATSVTGKDGHRAETLPLKQVLSILKRYKVINN